MTNDKILVSEIFGPTIQGEGAMAGRVTLFVRTGGCDFKCAWCDTPNAVLPCNRPSWQPMSATQVFARIEELTGGVPCLVTISGGNPALQPLGELLDWLRVNDYESAMETQGSVAKDWFEKLDHLILSPKPPSSGMEFKPERLRACLDASGYSRTYRGPRRNGAALSLKVVVMSEQDYEFARTIYFDFARPLGVRFYLTPGNHTPPPGSGWNAEGREFDQEGVLERTRWLVERCRADRWHDVSIIPQLHTLLWENKQGV